MFRRLWHGLFGVYAATVFVVMTAFGTISSAVVAIKKGADNYLTKPLDYEALSAVVDRAMEKEIATRLGLSQGTVRNYLSEAIGKLGVGNRIEAYRLARQKGWL